MKKVLAIVLLGVGFASQVESSEGDYYSTGGYGPLTHRIPSPSPKEKSPEKPEKSAPTTPRNESDSKSDSNDKK